MRRLTLRLLLGISAALALAACSGADLVNGLTPKEGYSLQADIAYGSGPRHRIDLYLPEEGEPKALVLFFYGGSWERGERGDYLFVGQAFASQGVALAVPDYRLYPEVRFPVFLEDAAAAVAWAKANHDLPVFLVGHSAGAYNAVMLALDDRWLGAAGLKACGDLAGVIGLAGPYDFLPLKDPDLKIIFGPPEGRAATQPITYVTSEAPPLLLLSGDADGVVDPRNSTVLAARQRAAGGEAAARLYEGLGHIRIVGALSSPLRNSAPVLEDILSFIEAKRGAAGAAC